MSSPSDDTVTPHENAIAQELARYRPRRSQRYSAVNVLVVTWKDDDIGVADEVAEVIDHFRQQLNFIVWPYHIPSQSSQSELQVHVAQFIQQCGIDEDALVILFYSGHGGQTLERSSSECVWAAQRLGGPELDWSIIQPLFLGANCDVVIILDCCFAGQAVRARLSRNVEFLAATDKDQFTPTGKVADRPSFTRILLQELQRAQVHGGSLTISELHRRMLNKENRLIKQPFYVKLAQRGTSVGIRLAKWASTDNITNVPPPSLGDSVSLYLRLSLFHPLDLEKRDSMLRWLTRDSPAQVEHIEVVRQTILDARSIEQIGGRLLQHEVAEPQAASTQISSSVRKEADLLIKALKESLELPEACQFGGINVEETLDSIGEKSRKLLTFLTDNLSTLNEHSLASVRAEGLPEFRDLRSRVAMRLVLIQNELPVEPTKVYFDHPAPEGQNLWMGRQADQTVMVEYWHYESSDRDISALSSQAARVSALLSESKDPAFRILPGLGFTHETIRKRFGFIYEIPAATKEGDFCTLADLIATIKVVPLEIRTSLASAICDAILHLHSIGWYHKAITSKHIVILRSSNEVVETTPLFSQYDMASPYLVGFDCSRPSEAETWASVDYSMEGNLYRHPERWGAPKRFERYHDLYAMGILLLEIGCWRLLPSMDGKRKNFESLRNPEKLRETLLTICESKLMHAAGSRYSEAVMTCLKKQSWDKMEPWQAQQVVREQVWRPLKREREARLVKLA